MYGCGNCGTFLTNRDELVSTRFTGSTGRAYLFKKVVNLCHRFALHSTLWTEIIAFLCSEPTERTMLTGRHWVRDVFCKFCKDKLGWMYEFALEKEQRYKESHVILEKALIQEKEGFVEDAISA